MIQGRPTAQTPSQAIPEAFGLHPPYTLRIDKNILSKVYGLDFLCIITFIFEAGF
jgi:hypothetical protein